MRTIPLEAVPNQEFSVTLGESTVVVVGANRWDIKLKEADGCMLATVVLNEDEILTNQRVVAESPIIPYKYLQGYGNFVILTENEEIPYYDKFEDTQTMIYVTPGEVF